VIHDLGSGSGAMMRWLAPRLPGPQRWVLHDADAGILEHRGSQPVADASGRPVISRTSIEQLAVLDASALHDATLVVASALLDVITASEARVVVDACVRVGAPALFSLSVVGRVEFAPRDPGDELFQAAFNDHQRRDADGRHLLGPDAVDVVTALFTEAGWTVRAHDSAWDLHSAEAALIDEWLDGWLDAAVEQQPALADRAVEFRAERRAQLVAGALSVVVQHRDVLAWPA
jgi:hypothetical protein